MGQTEVKSVLGEESGSIFFGKLTNNGDLSWNLTIDFSNGTEDQTITFIKQTTDEGYIIGGTSNSGDCCHSWILKSALILCNLIRGLKNLSLSDIIPQTKGLLIFTTKIEIFK